MNILWSGGVESRHAGYSIGRKAIKTKPSRGGILECVRRQLAEATSRTGEEVHSAAGVTPGLLHHFNRAGIARANQRI